MDVYSNSHVIYNLRINTEKNGIFNYQKMYEIEAMICGVMYVRFEHNAQCLSVESSDFNHL